LPVVRVSAGGAPKGASPAVPVVPSAGKLRKPEAIVKAQLIPREAYPWQFLRVSILEGWALRGVRVTVNLGPWLLSWSHWWMDYESLWRLERMLRRMR